MPRLFRRSIRANRDGTFEVRLSDDERAGLRHLFAQLAATLADDADDPALRTLFPPTYGEDTVRDAAYQAMVGDELLSTRLGALATAMQVTEADEVTEDDLIACMQGLNSLRLVLAARLGITDEAPDPRQLADLDSADPEVQGQMLYHYLSALLDEMVSVIGG